MPDVFFSEQLSFKGTRADRERLEALCRQLEEPSGAVLRRILREKAAEVLGEHRKAETPSVSV
jgi:hypothetical protein